MLKVRKLPLAALLATTASLAAFSASAQTQTLVFAGPGGATEERLRTEILPAFEAANNVTIQYVASDSGEILAKLEAQKNSPEIDLVSLPDSSMIVADQRGACAPLEAAPVYDEIMEEAKYSPNWIATSINYSVIAYNTEMFTARSLPEPTSWLDLGKPEYESEMALLSIGSSSTGLNSLVMVARALGGGENDIDDSFAFFQEKVKPNLITVIQSSSKLSEMLQTGEISIGVVIASRASTLIKGGTPIKTVVPVEGSPIAMTAVCPVANGKNPELTQKLVQYLISVDGQQGYPDGELPVNTGVTGGDAAPEKLVRLDLDVISANFNSWVDRWNREIER